MRSWKVTPLDQKTIPKTVGEALIDLLEQAGTDTVFGIPGVHTVELYRGLAASGIRHITPRHEQGAAFMADGYARITGRPGVCFLITGPGLTNAATAILQARGESVPMLIISSVNTSKSLGKNEGHLHEMPDQAAFSRSICKQTFTLSDPAQLGAVFLQAFTAMTDARPGPVHIQIPLDVMKLPAEPAGFRPPNPKPAQDFKLTRAARLCNSAKNPVILIGGGTAHASDPTVFQTFANALDAPVISTANGRGIMSGSPLDCPASPSLTSIRALIAQSDLVIALGTEIGPTDYDMYATGPLPPQTNMIRVDIDPAQLAKRSDAGLIIEGDAARFAAALTPHLIPANRQGTARTAQALKGANAELSAAYGDHIDAMESIWTALPDAIVIGDSTQPIYAGNLLINAPAPRTWFNSSAGFGTLGYAAPAAIGAAMGTDRPVVCVIGDGGLQFTLTELAVARDTGANAAFVVWNNHGYGEIETSMTDAGVSPVGVTPMPPDFIKIADAYGLASRRITDPHKLAGALGDLPRPCLIEYDCPKPKS